MAQNKSGTIFFRKQKMRLFLIISNLCAHQDTQHLISVNKQKHSTTLDFLEISQLVSYQLLHFPFPLMFTFHLQALFSSFISLPWPFAESPFSSKKSPLASTWVRVAWLWWHNCVLCSRALASLPWFWSSFWTFTTALSSLGRFFTWWPPSVLFRISLGTRVVINCFLLIYGVRPLGNNHLLLFPWFCSRWLVEYGVLLSSHG